MWLKQFFLFLFISFPIIYSHRILVFSPATSKSHLISNGRIADELARAGHNVTLLEIDFLEIAETTKTAKVAKKRVVGGLKNGIFLKNILSSFSSNAFDDGNLMLQFQGFWSYQKIYNQLCQEVIENQELFEELKAANFDAFFSEQINFCGFGYAHALGIPHKFLISSCPFDSMTYDQTGLTAPLSTVPISSDMSLEPGYFERMNNLFSSVLINLTSRLLASDLTEIFRNKFGKGFPAIYDLVKEVDFTFIATDEIIDYSSQTLQNIHHIGGLGIDHDSLAELDETFSKEMEKGENGVILFSLGTIANTSRIPNKVMESFLEIVQKFPNYHFLIRADKYDQFTREKAKNVKNVFVSDWLPQPSILNHSRFKLFITHAGYNSLIEAARAGIPLITIPFMFDQNLNSRAVEKKGWGIRRVKHQLLQEPKAIENAIREVLTNPSYSEKAHRIQRLIKSKPQSSTEKFVKTVEWVISNEGVDEIKYDARHIGIIQFYNLDIIIPFFIIPIYFLIPFILRLYSFSCFGHLKNDKIKND